MRIPISEEQLGLWYPIGKGYYFVPEYSPSYKYYENKYRYSTFKEFKKELPFIIRGNEFRSKIKI